MLPKTPRVRECPYGQSLTPSPLNRASFARGFTLIEIVLALLVLGILLTVAYSGLNGIMESSETIQDRRISRAITNALLSRMTRELQLTSGELAVLPPITAPSSPYPGAPRLITRHEQLPNGLPGDSITFVAREAGQYVMDGTTHTGSVQITYRVEPDPDAPENRETFYLIRDETPYKLPAEKAYEDIMTFPITKNLESLSFLMFDGEKGEWVEEWGVQGATSKLPTMIQFSVRLRSAGGKSETFTTAVPLRVQD